MRRCRASSRISSNLSSNQANLKTNTGVIDAFFLQTWSFCVEGKKHLLLPRSPVVRRARPHAREKSVFSPTLCLVLIVKFSICLMSCGASDGDTTFGPGATTADSGADVANVVTENDLGEVVAADANLPIGMADGVIVDGQYADDIGANLGVLGDPCERNADCQSGTCVKNYSGKVCTEPCVSDCPSGWTCAQDLGSLPDLAFVCLPLFPSLCFPCHNNSDCGSQGATSGARCLVDGENGAFCGGYCEKAQCPDGFVCEERLDTSGESSKQCVPQDGICLCFEPALAINAGALCYIATESGTCYGERICTKDGLSPCDAALPRTEKCDGADNDCDGRVDEGFEPKPCEITNDDGVCKGVEVCQGTQGIQCSAATPANEACDGKDNDCDGNIDENDALGCVTRYVDGDSDGYGVGDGLCSCTSDGVHTATEAGDCDDTDTTTYPGASEFCNGKDDDCDGAVDELGSEGCSEFLLDSDQDGFGVDGVSRCLCSPQGAYWATVGGDCSDQDAAVHPGAPEICNGKDDDCNGVVDDDGAGGCTPFFADVDQDGWGTEDSTLCTCVGSAPYTAIKSGDCDDGDAQIHPGHAEVCNGKDDDCDAQIDEGTAVGCTPYYKDADLDGYGISAQLICLCAPLDTYSATVGGDCDDKQPTIHPNATETCNGQDDNCNQKVDEPGALGCTEYYKDSDQDGFGQSEKVCLCGSVSPYSVLISGDCNDGNPAQNPLADEVCNGVDDDCDGALDEAGATGCSVFYADMDTDGWGNGTSSLCSCGPEDEFAAKKVGDCDDQDSSVHPGVDEVCNGMDDDCDGDVDEEGALLCESYYVDLDGDGTGVSDTKSCLCAGVQQGVTTSPGDCDDANPAVFPGAFETCNATDDNCDGATDEGCGLPTLGWPTFKYDERRTSFSPVHDGPSAANLKWKKKLNPQFTSIANSVAITTDNALIVLLGNQLYRVDLAGNVQWQTTLPGVANGRSSPTLRVGGTMVVPAGDTLLLLKPDGKPIWSLKFPGETITSTPIVDSAGEAIYVVSSGGLRRVSISGTVMWTSSVPNTGKSPGHPAIAPNGRIHYASSNHTVYSFHPVTGLAVWAYTDPGGADTDGSVGIGSGGDIYQAFGNILVRLSPSGQFLKSVDVKGDMDSDVAVYFDGTNDFPYTNPNGNTGLRKYNADLVSAWVYALNKDGSFNAIPAIDKSGNSYCGGNDGKVVSVTPSGSLRWSFTTDNAHVRSAIAVGPGFVVFGDDSGTIYFVGQP